MTTPAYTTPLTAVDGYDLTADDWNDGVRDSMEAVAKPPRVMVSRVTAQSVGSGAISAALWTAEAVDTDGFWAPGGSADRFIVPAGMGGLYLVTFAPVFNINATGGRYAAIFKNGAATGSPANLPGSASWYVQPHLAVPVSLVPGDYIQGMVYQNSGVALNLAADVYPMSMTMTRLGVA